MPTLQALFLMVILATLTGCCYDRNPGCNPTPRPYCSPQPYDQPNCCDDSKYCARPYLWENY